MLFTRQAIDRKDVADGRISRKELLEHFKGDTAEVDYYMEQVDCELRL